MINRDDIVDELKSQLINIDYIYAMWLEGSDGNNTVDKYSDIDIWLDVEDEHIKDCIELVEKILASISEIDFMYDMKHPHSKIEQRIYHIEDTSEFLMIDFCWQFHSREKIYFNINDKIENVKIIFDKADVIGFNDEQEADSTDKRHQIKEQVEYRFSQSMRVLKYVHRGQYLEALNAYNDYIFSSMVQFLRSIYTPDYVDFKLLHISQHLPKEYVDRITYFGQIASLYDIEIKTKEAKVWFDKLVKKYS